MKFTYAILNKSTGEIIETHDTMAEAERALSILNNHEKVNDRPEVYIVSPYVESI